MIVFILLALMVYMVPGLYFARGYYSDAIKTFRTTPKQLVPPKPPRPQIKLHEMLHQAGPMKKCGLLGGGTNGNTTHACSCSYRDDWITLKNEWDDYDEWVYEYGHIKNGVENLDEPSVSKALMVVPTWPIYAAAQFISKGAEGIPDYREIERMEEELKQLTQ